MRIYVGEAFDFNGDRIGWVIHLSREGCIEDLKALYPELDKYEVTEKTLYGGENGKVEKVVTSKGGEINV